MPGRSVGGSGNRQSDSSGSDASEPDDPGGPDPGDQPGDGPPNGDGGGDGPPNGDGGGDGPPNGDGGDGRGSAASGGSTLWKWTRRIGIALVLFVVLIVILFATGVLGVPSAGVDDVGDWGEVDENRTEIVTTVWVNNPNPVGLSFGDSVTVDYDVHMNDVHMAEGSRSGITVPPGNSTKEVSTDLRNERLNDWWANFIEADETIDLAIQTTISIDAVLSGDFDSPPVEQRLLEGETPIRDALSGSVNSTSGDYSVPVDASELDDSALDGPGGGLGDAGSVRVGYEVLRGWASWGPVDENETTIRFHMELHNPGDVPLPAAPDGLNFSTEANDVTMFEGGTDDMSIENVDGDTMIQPDETRVVNVSVEMDNDNVDDWFRSHVRNGEVSQLSSQFQVLFEEPTTGRTFRIPDDPTATYDCKFGTAMLVDDPQSGTNCGDRAG